MNSRFAVATFALTFMSIAPDRLVTSEELAASVNTHPALLRRFLSVLRAAGLVETQLGPGGGARLARAPEAISLLDVYDAMRAIDDLFAVGRISPNPECPMGNAIRSTLSCALAQPEQALRQALGAVTIRTLLDEARICLGAPAAQHAPKKT